MNEHALQQYILKFFGLREDEGGLGYEITPLSIVSNDLFIPSHLERFISESEPQVWAKLLRKFRNDKKRLLDRLKEEIKKRLLNSANAATFFNRNQNISFEGETVPLYGVSNTLLRGNEYFDKNIFAVVEENSHTIKCDDKHVYTVRPDISFFLNGIFIGYMELKNVATGQSADFHGRNKVVKDYLATVKEICLLEQQGIKVDSSLKEMLCIYEKAIHLTASDYTDTYVLRNMGNFYDTVHADFTGDTPSTIEAVKPKLLDVFKPYPVTSASLTPQQRFEEVMRALYSKKMIEKEILYYNFLEYRYTRTALGLERNSNRSYLVTPRPKQKFGCDKIMSRIREMLDHEKEPNYYTEKLRKELIALDIPSSKIEEILVQRNQFCNNKYVYSLLMQYAAGFGKSNIICWTALQLKDFQYEGSYAYDKIMIVVDRLQLRDQLDISMHNMNIDKSMFVEAVDKPTFIAALNSNKRIIVVNIQKFLDLQSAIDESGTKLKQMRVAFLIDEIHRSNSGDTHGEMINIFTRLQETFKAYGQTLPKKNLIVGFTATPDDETLTRFGEFRSAYVVPLWVPFDSYTMQEAIADGYILDPTKYIIPVSVPVTFALPEEMVPNEEGNYDIRQRRQDVYDNEERMEKVARFVVERLVTLVYGKIRGEGKAMLAVTTIPNAIRYTNIIRKLFAEKCKEKAFAKYKDAPIAIVYSDSQEYEACSTMNGGVAEEKVIQNFKQAKNGLIIVVDKLQTGFDEPKLHTLFLDKEIKSINAIQTISRVNRTCKYKTECHVIDLSYQNVNVTYIANAFAHFCNMTTSSFNPEEEAKAVVRFYGELTGTELFVKWFKQYEKLHEDVVFSLNLQKYIRDWVVECRDHELAVIAHNKQMGLKPGDVDYELPLNPARDLRKLIGDYITLIMMLKDVFVIDAKYNKQTFLDFWVLYCTIYNNVMRRPVSDGYIYEIVGTEDIGIVPGVIPGEGGEEEPPHGPTSDRGPSILTTSTGQTIEEILRILDGMNEIEEVTAHMAKQWVLEIGKMFKFIYTNNKSLVAMIGDSNYSEDELFLKYKSYQNIYSKTQIKQVENFCNIEDFQRLLEANAQQLFRLFVNEVENMTNERPDFCYILDEENTVADNEKLDVGKMVNILKAKEDSYKACESYAQAAQQDMKYGE